MNKELERFKIIKEMYEYFVKTYRKLEPKLMICEKEDFETVETALKEKEEQDNVNQILKDVIRFGKKLPDFEVDESGDIQGIFGAVGMRIQRQMENRERELLRNWVLKECFPKELKALEIIKKYANKDGIHIDFSQVMKATVKNFDYTTMTYIVDEELIKEYDLLKEVLL